MQRDGIQPSLIMDAKDYRVQSLSGVDMIIQLIIQLKAIAGLCVELIAYIDK